MKGIPSITRIVLTTALVIVSLPVESGLSPPVTLSANSWTPIGPAPAVGGGPFSGRIDVAASDPSNSSVMYVGANVGGIWKTTNWLDASPTYTEISNQPQILSLAIHEHDLIVFNSSIILAAASGPGGGVLRSDDAGNTWSYFANAKFDLAEFGAIVVDPNVANAQTVYVAISGGATDVPGSGLYKSIDGGATWTDAGLGTFSGFVSDILLIQESGQTVLYAADAGNALPNSGGIFRSANGGMTWTPTNIPLNPVGFRSIRLAGSTAPTEQIYASALDASAGDGGLDFRYVTSDQGANWSALTTPDAPAPGPRHRSHHNSLAVDPANSSILFVNTDIETNLNHPNRGEFMYRSTDSGSTWNSAGGAGDPVSGMFDSAGIYVATGDNGVYRRNPTTLALDQKCGNLNAAPFYSFSLNPNDPRSAFGLMQDAPGVLRYVGTLQWQYFQPPNGGEAGKIRVDPTNTNRAYFLDPNTTDPISSPSDAARFVHSDDGGQTWTAAITGLPTAMNMGVTITDYASFPGKGSIVIDPSSPMRLLIGIHNSVFETTTGGDPNTADPKFNNNGWRDLAAGSVISASTWVSSIALAPSDPNTIFAGTEDGRIFKTTDAGSDCNPNCPTWTEVDSGLPGQRIMDLEIDPANADHDFAVTSDFLGRDDAAPDYSGSFHVWMRNGGAWSPINGNLPTKLGGESLAVDWGPATPVLYIGTLRGGYKSTDLGTTWNRITTLPRTRVTDLDFAPNIHLLGAGTLGWGGWLILTQSTPPTIVPPAGQMSAEGSSHSFNLGSFSDPDGGPWSVDINWGDGTAHTTFTAGGAGPLPNKSHTYTEEGPYTVTIGVTDTLDNQSDSKTFGVNVTDPPVNASGGFSFVANTGVDTGPQSVATFTDPGGAEPNASDPTPPTSAGHYSASINWGDGTASPGAITPLTPSSPTQVFTVTGNHTYTMQSPVAGFSVITSINHESVISMATSTAIVGRAGRVNGNGKIGTPRTFNFDVKPVGSLTDFHGDLNYQDKANNINLQSTSITFVSILIDNKHATIQGQAKINNITGYTFIVDVQDNGTKGKGQDKFRIRISGPTSYDSNNFAASNGLLTAGNIKIFK